MTANTVRDPLRKAALKSEAVLPFFTSLIVAGPCTALSVTLMLQHVSLEEPWLWMSGIIVLGLVCMLAAAVLEPARAVLGRLTMAGLLAFPAVVMMYILTETLNRYMTDLGYEWLLPFVIAAQGLNYCGVFFEKHLPVKALLALNGAALSVLWCLGVAAKISLPF
jgi:hypothetical protein